MDASFKLTRQGIRAAYAGGSEAVVALFEETVVHFTAIIKQQRRITALEQELQELKKASCPPSPAWRCTITGRAAFAMSAATHCATRIICAN